MADWLPLAISAAGLGVALAAVLVAFVLRMQGRREPPATATVAITTFGAAMSLGLVGEASSGPTIAFITLGVPAGLLVLARAYRSAGWFLVGAAGSAAGLWAVLAIWEMLPSGPDARGELVVGLATSLAVGAVGVVGIGIGDHMDRKPAVPPDAPDPGRVTALAAGILRELRFGPVDLPNVVTIVAVIVLSTVAAVLIRLAGLGSVVTTLVVAAILPIVGTDLYYRVWPPRVRRAMATHAYLGSWELARFRREIGGAIPTSPDAARRWLRSHPESDTNRWVRAEILAMAGELREADAVITRLPTATEELRFERRSLQALMDIVSGREPDLARLAAEAERVGSPESDERRRAVAAVALAEARYRLVRGEGDWLEPLVGASARIGPDAFGIWRRDTWFVRFVVLSVIAATGIALTLPIAGTP